MRVALQKTSLIDYPGRVACVIFLPGCNLRCPYCHNAALVEPELHPEMQEDFIELEDAFVYLEKRKKVLEAVVISGGEPCIHGGLARLAERAAGLGLLVKLDTNGLFPERLPEIKVDFIALDLKTALSRYEELPGAGNGAEKRIRSTIDFLRKSGVGRE